MRPATPISVPVSKDVANRFFQKFTVDDGCWEWTGYRDTAGYGKFSINSKAVLAHRVSFALFNEQDPGEKLVCHQCDNPRCVRPGHLFAGTHSDNTSDMMSKGRINLTIGSRSGCAKLTENDVMEILADVESSNKRLSERFGVGAHTISRIRGGKRWRHLHDGRPRRGVRTGGSKHLSVTLDNESISAMERMRMVTGLSDAELARRAVALLSKEVLSDER